MRKLSALLAIVAFLSFSGLMNAQTQEAKKVEASSKKTEMVVKKGKKSKMSCGKECKDMSKCSDKEKTKCADDKKADTKSDKK